MAGRWRRCAAACVSSLIIHFPVDHSLPGGIAWRYRGTEVGAEALHGGTARGTG